ncbi:dihydrofolate reductase family protein [Micromonospora sp. WMMD812]|uniref:dihydrofolate reductase family protein n=1 Tax=Micromonospora sp. WMMD812 TaxID=3015152 RepID=UPI00248B459A|nr:dihydrofolate reductase family protein [Micromonospora sp. WMMD812]WBB67911.1 dihydrofolate reductase family protein [Micromonospora sp. WMMD812]
MARILLDVTMSLDGFMAGPDVSVENPMGTGGLRLHEWIFNAAASPVDARISGEMFETTGAVVLGRRTFDVGIGVWNDTPFPAPCFVLTHDPLADRVEKSGTFAFVTDVRTAFDRSTAAAGRRDVRLMGAEVGQQFLAAGLVDEIRVQIAPLLLGRGRRLFAELDEHVELERLSVEGSPYASHLRFRVRREAVAP